MYRNCVHTQYKNVFQADQLTVYIIFLAILVLVQQSHGQTHNNTLQLFKDKLSSDKYNIQVRPVIDQSQPVHVNVSFDILSIIEVNDVSQQFHCNGFLRMEWYDELVAWNVAHYGGQNVIHPLPKDVWKPRVVLINTLGDRDIFEEDNAPLIMFHDGHTNWLPGSLFSTPCDLDMTKYPYDEQICNISFFSMGWHIDEVMFHASSSEVRKQYFSPHDEWELKESFLEVVVLVDSGQRVSSFDISFKLQRRASFILLNIILPVVFLSLLNLLVFAIPGESGEKLSYGITVLLALAVYLSIISGMLPRTSGNLPLVNKYIFTLFILSVLAVVDSIVIVFISSMEQKHVRRQRAKGNVKTALNQISRIRAAVQPFANGDSSGANPLPTRRPSSTTIPSPDYFSRQSSAAVDNDEEDPPTNKYKLRGKYINAVSLVVFSFVWLCLTLGFMITIST